MATSMTNIICSPFAILYFSFSNEKDNCIFACLIDVGTNPESEFDTAFLQGKIDSFQIRYWLWGSELWNGKYQTQV